jgi:hypothetical protein
MNFISRPLTTALAISGAAILVASVTLASTSHSAAARQTAATAPACVSVTPSQPHAAFVWASLPGNGFAGGVGYTMEITNEGRFACTVRGVPGAAIQDNNGHLIGGEIPPSGKGRLITLKPGATANFSLEIHEALIVCPHPVNGQVVIFLPGQKHAQNGWLPARGCKGQPGGGVLSPGPIKAGTGIPWYSI